MSIEEYRRFIASRSVEIGKAGFDPRPINDKAKAHQVAALEFALNAGKSASFLDTGLGKSFIELEFARQCAEETGKPSLILTPLAVAGQMVREGNKFGIDARQIREQSEVGAGVMVANYERLPKLDPSAFGAVILDESSILKSYAGQTRARIQDAFKDTHYKLAATATPSPNDHTELGNHAEFLGVMRQQEMLSKWFINDTSTASQDWRLKGHATDDFWQWVASWSRCATLPSDLGGDDTGYILPEIERRMHEVEADRSQDTQGMLFRIPEMSATSFHAEKRLTLRQRCERASSIVFSDICAKLAEIMQEHDLCHGSQNTQPLGVSDTIATKKSEHGALHKADRQKKTKNTCVDTTPKTQTNLSGQKKIKIDTTQGAESDTLLIQNMQKEPSKAHVIETQNQGATAGLNQHTEYLNLNMKQCSMVRDFVVWFVQQSTKKKEERDFTSITATISDTSGDCYAQHVTRLLGKCVMMLKGCETQFDILKPIVCDPVLIFCETNDEQDCLEELFGGGAFSVRGSDNPDKKEQAIIDWCDGERPWLISKSSIVGFGMNFQHCAHVIFASISFSYEKFYQALRRVYRFGQLRVVRAHIITSDTERSIWEVINVKGKKHDEMKRRMSAAMRKAQSTSQARIKYNRPLDLAFPEWLKGEKA